MNTSAGFLRSTRAGTHGGASLGDEGEYWGLVGLKAGDVGENLGEEGLYSTRTAPREN